MSKKNFFHVFLLSVCSLLLPWQQITAENFHATEFNKIASVTKSILNSYENLGKIAFPKKVEYLTNSINPIKKHKEAKNIISGKGSSLSTDKGEMIDMSSMTVNCILGQNDPWVKANLIAYNLTDQPSFHSTSFGSFMYYTYAKRVCDVKIANIKNPIINHRQSNGSDVTELAILSAKNANPKRKKVVSFGGSYHGQNLTAYTVSDVQTKHKFMYKDINDENVILGTPSNAKTIDPSSNTLSQNDNNIIKQLKAISKDVYAVIIEPIQGNNGLNMCSRGFMNELRKVCTKNNICLIFDEAQTGWGWLGKMSAAEVYDVIPDICVFSKAVTSGYGPLSLMVAKQKYGFQPYGTAEKTNGGDLRSLVAGNAVLDRLLGISTNPYLKNLEISSLPIELQHDLKEGLLKTSYTRTLGLLNQNLKKLQKSSNKIGKLKGYGLVRGFEILNNDGAPDNSLAQKFAEECYNLGVFVKNSNNTIMLRPSLTINKKQMDKAFKIFSNVLQRI